jgi:hypothetical protein
MHCGAVGNMKNKGGIAVAIIFLLIGLFGIIESANFHYWESITLPLIISCFISVLAGLQLVLEFRQRPKNQVSVENENTASDENWDKGQINRAVRILIWIAALIIAIYLIGFYVAVPLFCFVFLKWNARGWITSLLFGIIIIVLIYLIFNVVLKTPLYQGLFFRIWK